MQQNLVNRRHRSPLWAIHRRRSSQVRGTADVDEHLAVISKLSGNRRFIQR